jgi:RNA polymerase sigma-70 factor (ECF subfamily)
MMLRRRKGSFISVEEPFESKDQDQEPLQIVDWCCLPERELMSMEARAYLDQAVEALPPNLRVAFLLRDIEGLSTRETSEVLNLSESAVKTRLSRARLRLREYLTSYYGEHYQQRLSEGGKN